MTFKEAKQIDIVGYLEKQGFYPVRKYATHYLYKSPIRDDKKPSFVVNTELNLWIDKSTGLGGSIIDLVMEHYNVSNHGAIGVLSSDYSSLDIVAPVANEPTPAPKKGKGIEVRKIKPLANVALTGYAKNRGISEKVAGTYLKEMYYTANNKPYFALCWANIAGGYELRNKYTKVCTEKAYSIIKGLKTARKLLVFEGMFDFLSYAEIQGLKNLEAYDVIVLNSVGETVKIADIVKGYEKVYLFLDNDKAGNKATDILFGENVTDCREMFYPYKDLNEFLING